MSPVRISVGTVVGVALAVACSSSSSSNKPPADAGADSSVPTVADSAPAVPCNTAAGSPLCAAGTTCCTPGLDIASLLGGLTGGAGGGTPSLTNLIPSPSCVPTGSCNGTTMDCASASNCSGDQVCCSGTATPEGGADAEAEAGEGPFGGGVFGGGTFSLGTSTTCQTSCMPGQQQRCASDTECTGGQTCQPSLGFPGLPGFAGGGGDGGNPFASFFGGDGGSPFGDLFGGGDDAGATMYCSPPDAGTGPDTGLDTGSDAASDAGTSDVTTAFEAGVTSDASGVDAELP
ncbi:MAG: hypothetical protein ACLP1X_11880 [Polyangiaceae bacterium]|jgi:hypothetical protein